jgi:hypothetical protein
MRKASLSGKAAAHIEEARRNLRRFEATVDADPDLAVTELFWAALHLVQAHATQARERNPRFIPPLDHKARAIYIDNELNSIAFAYKVLRTASEDTRYDLVRSNAATAKDLRDVQFESIKRYLETRGIRLGAGE